MFVKSQKFWDFIRKRAFSCRHGYLMTYSRAASNLGMFVSVISISARCTENLHDANGQGIVHIHQAMQNICHELRIVHHLFRAGGGGAGPQQ